MRFVARKRGLIILLLLAIVGSAAVWFLYRPDASARSIRNVLLISIDTCRADRLSCYGYKSKTTPNIDAVAAEGILFENVIAPVPLTLPSHSSMLTGTIPPYHGVHSNTNHQLAKSNLTLAEILGENGFKTAAIVSAFVLDSTFGIDQGFDTYNDQFEEAHKAVGISERKGGETTRLVLEWLEKQKDEKSFLFLHYYDPHFDYVPPEPFASQFADNPYAGEVAYTDHCIGQVLDKLKELGLYDSTLVIITSDHGEMLGEHGEVEHGYFIYQSAIRVPLIFKLPRSSESQRISRLVGIVDIVPTICNMLGITVPQDVQGQDLSPYFNGKSPDDADRHVYCETIKPLELGANSLLGIVNNRFKYIQTTRPELYDLIKDPTESNNLVETQQQRASIMKDTLAQVLEQSLRKDAIDSEIVLDPQAIKSLESIGYVHGTATEEFKFDQSKKDPKDLIEFAMVYRRGIILVNQKRYEQAITAFDKGIELNPTCAQAYYNRGSAYLRTGELDKAITDFNQAIGLDPQNAQAYGNRGIAYDSKGELDKAITDFSQAIRLDPKFAQAYNNLAWIFATHPEPEIRDVVEAVRLAERACELTNYRSPAILDTLAAAYAQTGQFDQAVKTATKAVNIARAAKNEELAKDIQSRLDLYKAKRPYRPAAR